MDNDHDNHLTISRVKNRSISLTTNKRTADYGNVISTTTTKLTTERFTYDYTELNDSAALHQVLTIRDPGNDYSIRFKALACPYHSVIHLAGPCEYDK